MTTIRMAYLPDEIKVKNKIYAMGEKTVNSIRVEVLSRRLRGKKDLHGNLYNPSVFFFNPK